MDAARVVGALANRGVSAMVVWVRRSTLMLRFANGEATAAKSWVSEEVGVRAWRGRRQLIFSVDASGDVVSEVLRRVEAIDSIPESDFAVVRPPAEPSPMGFCSA